MSISILVNQCLILLVEILFQCYDLTSGNFLLMLVYKYSGLRSYFSGGGCFSLSVPRTSASISERSIFFSLMAFYVDK